MRYTEYHAGIPVIKDRKLLPEAMKLLAAYEDIGLTPEQVLSMQKMQEEEGDRWISIMDRVPDKEGHFLVSFANCSMLMIGKYVEDKGGAGAFYPEGEDASFSRFDLFVNAWRPLPKPYRRGVKGYE